MKVIIAEDEKWVRNTIISVIPFKKLNLQLVGEASNGLEALEMCKQLKPEILVTDIMMPGLDGLKLIIALKKILPHLRIIIISGYSEFEYSKTAIKHGVKNYILKPIDEEELENTLYNVKKEIINEKKQNYEKNKLKSKYKTAIPIVHENLLNKIIHPNTMTVSNIKKNLEESSINFNLKYFTIIVFHLPDVTVFTRSKHFEKHRKLINDSFPDTIQSAAFKSYRNSYEIITILNHDKYRINDFYNILHSVISKYKKIFDDKLSAGISMTTSHIKNLPDYYCQALRALDTGMWYSNKNIFFFTPDNMSQNLPLQLNEHMIENAVCNIKLSDCSIAFSYIDELYDTLRNHKFIDPKIVKEFFWTLTQSIIYKLDIYFPFLEYESSILNNHPYEQLKNLKTFEHLCLYIKKTIEKACNFYHDNLKTNNNIIGRVKNFIEENYCNEITLEKIANHVYLNTTYLSELFKKETGMSFIEYKTILRINHAKKLLESTDLNASEISTRIGYTDSKYFSKLFKKITGSTITEFRKKHR